MQKKTIFSNKYPKIPPDRLGCRVPQQHKDWEARTWQDPNKKSHTNPFMILWFHLNRMDFMAHALKNQYLPNDNRISKTR
ncbi:hypothetical protein OIU78_013543 [Salix suchowensis]|nr:hypothetical protein OIU78_013543 [Salix suchowensis]